MDIPLHKEQTPEPVWSSPKKLAFRFFFLFFVCYIFYNPNGFFPYVQLIHSLYIRPFHHLIPWLAKHVLHLSHPVTAFTGGSGDTTYDFLMLLFVFVLALIGCFVWSVLDRRHLDYAKLNYWLILILRLYAGLNMINYGLVKVIKLQFPSPGLFTMLEPYGESSPMGLAWRFMGYSDAYNYFAGIAEITAGMLLLFRRTLVPGAMLSFVVCANIMAMNYCFDIPVKLFSTMLVVMSLYLLSDNFRSIIGFLFRKEQVSLRPAPAPPFQKKRTRILWRTGKCVLVAFILIVSVVRLLIIRSTFGDAAPHVAFRGIYDVKTFIRNKDTLPALLTDTFRWRQLVIDGSTAYGYASIRRVNDSSSGNFKFKPDTVLQTMTLTSNADSTNQYSFNYRFPQKDSLVLVGAWKNDSLEIRLKLHNWKDFLLVRRGFHWINEFPLNR